jgi:hypothetical protein
LDFELPYLWSDGRNLDEKVKKNNITLRFDRKILIFKNTYIFSFDKRMVQFCARRESITEIIRVRRAMVDPMDLRSSMDPSIESVPENRISKISFKKICIVQLNEYKADLFFLQFLQSNTTVCLIIHVACKSCEPEIVFVLICTLAEQFHVRKSYKICESTLSCIGHF